MTRVLYMPDIEANYIREFRAKVLKSGDGRVMLDQTAFYPLGGGQPPDTGMLKWDSGSVKVVDVRKKGDAVLHFTDGDVPSDTVRGIIDWDRRYSHMRMHTAQHLISGVVYDMFGARTAGNQIHAEYSRIDFSPASFSQEEVEEIVSRCNELISKGAHVKIYFEDRESLERRVDPVRSNLVMVPRSVKTLRIVEIPGIDLCPCAGTHVRDIKEIGRIVPVKRESKGADKVRIIYSLA